MNIIDFWADKYKQTFGQLEETDVNPNESVLDQPKADLCEDVWQKTEKGYELTTEARLKIEKVGTWLMKVMEIEGYGIHLTGSITSNSYSDDSDIDLHFLMRDEVDGYLHLPKEETDKLTEKLRAEYDENYKDMNPQEDWNIGGHPIEVYFQGNEFQDYMSVGCYDVIDKKWIVGPEILDQSFDPYNEYYERDQEYIRSTIFQTRNLILMVYELATVILESEDVKFKLSVVEEFMMNLKLGGDIFDKFRLMRSNYSTPTSFEMALKNRESDEWKTADSAFKLLDKLGYLPILKYYKVSYQDINAGKQDIEKVAKEIVEKFDLD